MDFALDFFDFDLTPLPELRLILLPELEFMPLPELEFMPLPDFPLEPLPLRESDARLEEAQNQRDGRKGAAE